MTKNGASSTSPAAAVARTAGTGTGLLARARISVASRSTSCAPGGSGGGGGRRTTTWRWPSLTRNVRLEWPSPTVRAVRGPSQIPAAARNLASWARSSGGNSATGRGPAGDTGLDQGPQIGAGPVGLERARAGFAVDLGGTGALVDDRAHRVVGGQPDHAEDVQGQVGGLAGNVDQVGFKTALGHVGLVVGVVVDTGHGDGDAVADGVAGGAPFAAGDPDPAVHDPAGLGVGDEPLPVVRDTPVPVAPGVVAVAGPVPVDAADTDLQEPVDVAGLLQAVLGEPGGQSVGGGPVAERVVQCGEVVGQVDVVAIEPDLAGLPQLRLADGEPFEPEVVEVGLFADPAVGLLQRDRIGPGPPEGHVVAGPAAGADVQVDLQPQLLLGHDQFPEQAVAHPAAVGGGPVAAVVVGTEARIDVAQGDHGVYLPVNVGARRSVKAASASGMSSPWVSRAWPRFSSSMAAR